MTTIAMTAAATLGIAGIKHGILWGILAGILDALPFIGTGVVLVPLGMFQILDGNWGRALVCGVLYVVCIFLREVMGASSHRQENRGIPHSSASVVVCGNPAVWRLGDSSRGHWDLCSSMRLITAWPVCMTGSGSRAGGNEKRLTKEVAKAIIKVLDEACFGEMDLWQKIQKEKKQWNRWQKRYAISAGSCVIS